MRAQRLRFNLPSVVAASNLSAHHHVHVTLTNSFACQNFVIQVESPRVKFGSKQLSIYGVDTISTELWVY